MPRTTHTPPHRQNGPQNPALEDSKVNELTYSTTRLGLLQRTLYGLQSKNGKPIYKTLQQCGEYTGLEKTNVAYIGYASGKIIKSGVVRCENPECPVCGGSVSAKKVKTLKKALTEYKLDGGDLAFITITMRPTRDPVKGINAMKDLAKKINKLIRNKNRAFDEHDRIMAYATLEKTFSSKWASHDELGQPCSPFAYLHTHLHMVVGCKHELLPIKELVSTLQLLAKNTLSLRNGLYSFIEAPENTCTDTNNSVGFCVDYRDNTENLAEYLNKIVSTSEQLALEVGQDKSKSGKGMGLDTLLTETNRDPSNQLYQAHKKNIRIWFQEMYRARRSTWVGIDYWEKQFEERQRGMIIKWLDRHDLGPEYLNSAFSYHAMEYNNIDKVWVDDELAPIPITEEMKNRNLVVFREDVDTRLYNLFHRQGLESTLEHLFSKYWFDELYEDCYNAYRSVNLRFDSIGATKLIRLLNDHNLLRGSRANQYKQLRYIEV